MSKFKLLLLSPSFEEIGGVSSFCQSLLANLDSDYNVDHLEVGNPPGNKSPFKRLYSFFKNAFKLRKKLKENAYDVIHLNPSLEIFSLMRDSYYLWRIRRFHYKNTMVMFHGWNEKIAEKIIKNSLFKGLFRSVYNHAKLILVLSDQIKNNLKKIGISPKKIEVITTMYQLDSDANLSRGNILDNKVNILFMSRLIKSKGIDIAVDTAKLLFDSGFREFRLTIAGDGPKYSELVQSIENYNLQNHIHVLGFIEGEKKREVLRNNDIFIFPSESEGCPVVVLEAMAAGLAIVSTPVGAVPEIVKHGENGLIVDNRGPEDFYHSIKQLMDHRELLKEMQRNNIKKAEQNYEARIVTQKIQSMYSSIMSG